MVIYITLMKFKLWPISSKLVAQDLIAHWINTKIYYKQWSILSGSHREKIYSSLVFPPSMEAVSVNRLHQFVVLIKQLTFLENLTS